MAKVSSTGKAKFAIEFDNGVRLSFIWGAMTYSDNHDKEWLPHWMLDKDPELKKLGNSPEPDQIQSFTVEIMAFGPEEYVNFFEDYYKGNPASYVNVGHIPEILAHAQAFKPQKTLTIKQEENI